MKKVILSVFSFFLCLTLSCGCYFTVLSSVSTSTTQTTESSDDDDSNASTSTTASGIWTSYTSTPTRSVSNGVLTVYVSTAAQLAYVANAVNTGEAYNNSYYYKDANIVLSSDINLSDHYWVPIGRYYNSSTTYTYAFSGTFNGNGYTISGLTFDESLYPWDVSIRYYGLFGLCYYSSSNTSTYFKNVTIKGASFVLNRASYSDTLKLGVLAGAIRFAGSSSSVTIDEVYIYNPSIVITATSTNEPQGLADVADIGGIVGYLYGLFSITNCYVMGGSTEITACAYNYTWSDELNYGGLVGRCFISLDLVTSSSTLFNNCYNSMDFTLTVKDYRYTQTNVSIGGILGRALCYYYSGSTLYNFYVYNCINEGDITITGGLQLATYTTASGEYYYEPSGIGGIVGYAGPYTHSSSVPLNLTIQYCFNYGDISVSLCYSANIGIGGILGTAGKGSVLNSANFGDITVTKYSGLTTIYHITSIGVGGIVGYLPSRDYGGKEDNYYGRSITITTCINYGDISLAQGNWGDYIYAGGIAGYISRMAGTYNSSTWSYIQNCVNYGIISGYFNNAAGIVSYADTYVGVQYCMNYGYASSSNSGTYYGICVTLNSTTSSNSTTGYVQYCYFYRASSKSYSGVGGTTAYTSRIYNSTGDLYTQLSVSGFSDTKSISEYTSSSSASMYYISVSKTELSSWGISLDHSFDISLFIIRSNISKITVTLSGENSLKYDLDSTIARLSGDENIIYTDGSAKNGFTMLVFKGKGDSTYPIQFSLHSSDIYNVISTGWDPEVIVDIDSEACYDYEVDLYYHYFNIQTIFEDETLEINCDYRNATIDTVNFYLIIGSDSDIINLSTSSVIAVGDVVNYARYYNSYSSNLASTYTDLTSVRSFVVDADLSTFVITPQIGFYLYQYEVNNVTENSVVKTASSQAKAAGQQYIQFDDLESVEDIFPYQTTTISFYFKYINYSIDVELYDDSTSYASGESDNTFQFNDSFALDFDLYSLETYSSDTSKTTLSINLTNSKSIKHTVGYTYKVYLKSISDSNLILEFEDISSSLYSSWNLNTDANYAKINLSNSIKSKLSLTDTSIELIFVRTVNTYTIEHASYSNSASNVYEYTTSNNGGTASLNLNYWTQNSDGTYSFVGDPYIDDLFVTTVNTNYCFADIVLMRSFDSTYYYSSSDLNAGGMSFVDALATYYATYFDRAYFVNSGYKFSNDSSSSGYHGTIYLGIIFSIVKIKIELYDNSTLLTYLGNYTVYLDDGSVTISGINSEVVTTSSGSTTYYYIYAGSSLSLTNVTSSNFLGFYLVGSDGTEYYLGNTELSFTYDVDVGTSSGGYLLSGYVPNDTFAVQLKDGALQIKMKFSTSNGSGMTMASSRGVYEITTAEQLLWVANQVNSGSTNFEGYILRLMNNIDLSIYSTWTSIGTTSNPFKGVFDGNNYRISNLYLIENGLSNVGLFGVTDGAIIMDLTLYSGNVTGDSNVGTIVGYAINTTFTNVNNYSCSVSNSSSSTIYNIYGQQISSGSSSSSSDVTQENFGGIVGKAEDCSFVGCSNRGTITTSNTSNVGGLIGYVSGGSIDQCYTLYQSLVGSNSGCTLTNYYDSTGYYNSSGSKISSWTNYDTSIWLKLSSGSYVLLIFYW